MARLLNEAILFLQALFDGDTADKVFYIVHKVETSPKNSDDQQFSFLFCSVFLCVLVLFVFVVVFFLFESLLFLCLFVF